MTATGPSPPRPDLGETGWRSDRRAAAVLLVPTALALAIPFLSVPLSLLPPFLAFPLGPLVWPGPRRRIVPAAVLVSLGTWVGAVLAVGAWGVSTGLWFLLVPLCGPTDPLWLVAPAAGILVFIVGALISVPARNVWLWPVAAFAAGFTCHTVWALVEGRVSWIC